MRAHLGKSGTDCRNEAHQAAPYVQNFRTKDHDDHRFLLNFKLSKEEQQTCNSRNVQENIPMKVQEERSSNSTTLKIKETSNEDK